MTESVKTSPESTPTFTQLSKFLAGCSSTELLHILDEYDQGLLTVLESVPIEGQSFEVSVTQLNGKVIERTVEEEVIRDTPEARQWRDEKAESSRLAIMTSTGEISTTLEAVTNDPNEFDKLLASRRAFLKSNKGKAKPAVTQPKKPVKVAAPPSIPTKSTGKNSGAEAQSKAAESQSRAAQKPTADTQTTEE